MASIETRTSRGKVVYRVRFRHQKRQLIRTFDNHKGAETFRLLAEHSPEKALAALDEPEEQQPVTVAELLTLHIDSLTGIEEGTRSTYKGYLTRDIEPDPLGKRLARNVTRADAQAWIRRMEVKGHSGKTIANRRGLLSAAYTRTAIPSGLAESNPLDGIRVKKAARTKGMLFLTREEFATLLHATPPHYRLLVFTLVSSGLRISEALALQVKHFDAAAGTLRIEQAWKYTDGNGHELGDPKTLRGTRTVSLPSQCADAIAAHVKDRAAKDYIFTSPRGHILRRDIFRRDAWVHAVAALPEDRRPRTHDLRHTHASWAIQAGVPLPVLQRQLGHESISTTVDVYGGLARSDFDALASAIGASLPTLPSPTLPAIESSSASASG